MKIAVLFYSTHGHMFQMANAAAEGAREAGADVTMYRFRETLPDEVLEKMGALETAKLWRDIPVITPDDLRRYDGFILGVPTKYGLMASQVKAFLDSTGSLFQDGALTGKPVAVMSGTGTQHGGQELSIISTIASLMHHGMIPVGLPYAYQAMMRTDEIVGGSPYGATTIVGTLSPRQPSEIDLGGAKFQGKRLAEIAKKLAA